jgi:hypothetical protein
MKFEITDIENFLSNQKFNKKDDNFFFKGELSGYLIKVEILNNLISVQFNLREHEFSKTYNLNDAKSIRNFYINTTEVVRMSHVIEGSFTTMANAIFSIEDILRK